MRFSLLFPTFKVELNILFVIVNQRSGTFFIFIYFPLSVKLYSIKIFSQKGFLTQYVWVITFFHNMRVIIILWKPIVEKLFYCSLFVPVKKFLTFISGYNFIISIFFKGFKNVKLQVKLLIAIELLYIFTFIITSS
jgi:hypothetical protein